MAIEFVPWLLIPVDLPIAIAPELCVDNPALLPMAIVLSPCDVCPACVPIATAF